MSERIYSLSTTAEKLGTTARRLRYFLEKEQIIPDRRMTAGRYEVRYITDTDLKTLTKWWDTIDGGINNV
jgi:hypothetical protein